MVIGWCIVDFLKIFIIFHGYFDKNVSQKPNSRESFVTSTRFYKIICRSNQILWKICREIRIFEKMMLRNLNFWKNVVAKSEFLKKCCREIRIFEKMLSRNPKFGVVLKFSGLFKYPYVCLSRGWWVQGTFFPNFTNHTFRPKLDIQPPPPGFIQFKIFFVILKPVSANSGTMISRNRDFKYRRIYR